MSRLTAVLWLARELSKPVTGVNAIKDTVPSLSDWPRLADVAVHDEVTDLWVSGLELPETVGADGTTVLVVRRIRIAEQDVLPAGNGYDAITLAVHGFVRTDVGSAPRNAVAVMLEQQLRVARRVIARALPEFVQPTYPTLNGVEIAVPDQNVFTPLPLSAPIDASLLHDGFVVRLAVHDAFALGL